jgi:hypothetical protein
LRPYAAVGLGLLHVGIKDVVNLLPANGNWLGLSVGGGAIGHLTTRTSLRFDIRHIRTLGSARGEVPAFREAEISYWRLTAGLALLGRLF